jgi:hypothetical protein
MYLIHPSLKTSTIQLRTTFSLQYQRHRKVVLLMWIVTLCKVLWKIQGTCSALIISAIEHKE